MKGGKGEKNKKERIEENKFNQGVTCSSEIIAFVIT
jgi:hypothetical protein